MDKLRTLVLRPQRAWSERGRLFFVQRYSWRSALRGLLRSDVKNRSGDFLYSGLFGFQSADLRRAAQYLQGAVRVIGDQRVSAQVEQAAHVRLFVDGP